MKSNKTQLPDLLFLVLHQFLYQQMSFLQLSRISFNIFGKDFRPKFSFFNRFTPLLKPHALNGQNLLNMRKVFCQFSLKCFLKYFFFKNFMTKSCKAFFKDSNNRFSGLLFRTYFKKSYFDRSISNHL